MLVREGSKDRFLKGGTWFTLYNKILKLRD